MRPFWRLLESPPGRSAFRSQGWRYEVGGALPGGLLVGVEDEAGLDNGQSKGDQNSSMRMLWGQGGMEGRDCSPTGA